MDLGSEHEHIVDGGDILVSIIYLPFHIILYQSSRNYLRRERELRRSVRGVPSWQRCAGGGSERLAGMNIVIIIIIIVINIISIIIIMLAEVYWRRYCDPIWCDGEFVNIITGIIKDNEQ